MTRCSLLQAATAVYGFVTATAFPGEVQQPGASYLAIGDWGGWTDQKPASSWQLKTASGMNKVAGEIGAEAILLLGDNFYHAGVRSNTSSRFKTTWEDVYLPKEHLANLPYYVVLGNHDYLSNAKAQFDYNHPLWHLPSINYTVKKSWTRRDGGTATADMLFIDTVKLCPDYSLSPKRGKHASQSAIALSEQLWAWLEQQMKASTADYLLVAGHYPIYASGGEGALSFMVHRMLPLLKKYGGHYMSGHDHILGHYEEEGVHMFVSGIGRMCCYPNKFARTVPAQAVRFYISGDKAKGQGAGTRLHHRQIEGGFLAVQIYDDFAQFTFYDQEGVKLYEPSAVPKREKARLLAASEDIVL